MDFFSLPLEMLWEITSYLSPHDLLRFSHASRNHCQLFNDEFFWHPKQSWMVQEFGRKCDGVCLLKEVRECRVFTHTRTLGVYLSHNLTRYRWRRNLFKTCNVSSNGRLKYRGDYWKTGVWDFNDEYIVISHYNDDPMSNVYHTH